MRVVVVAPHPDDEVIGCGGTVCIHTERGDRVVAVFLTSGELGLKHLPRDQAWQIREQEAANAATVLGLADVSFLRRPDWRMNEDIAGAARDLAPIIDREHPQIVYVPHANDAHPDHAVSLAIVSSALQQRSIEPPTLLAYETWTPLAEYDRVEDITAVMRRKMRALRCHRSQIGYFRYDRAVRGLNQYRGALAARSGYAEVFKATPAWPGDGA